MDRVRDNLVKWVKEAKPLDGETESGKHAIKFIDRGFLVWEINRNYWK